MEYSGEKKKSGRLVIRMRDGIDSKKRERGTSSPRPLTRESPAIRVYIYIYIYIYAVKAIGEHLATLSAAVARQWQKERGIIAAATPHRRYE